MKKVGQILDDARLASKELLLKTNEEKNKFLIKLGENLVEYSHSILEKNAKDTKKAKKEKSFALVDRLSLSQKKIRDIILSTEKITKLDDYVGNVTEKRILPNGISLEKIRIPMGVIAIVFESRPNVAIDAVSIAIKSGNAIILRGGSDAKYTIMVLTNIIQKTLKEVGFPENAVQNMDTDRKLLMELIRDKKRLDLVIPRGGKNLIDFIAEYSNVPIIETGASIVHAFIDKDANLEKAIEIIKNSKMRRVSICNALDVVLIDRKIAKEFLKKIGEVFSEKVEMLCDEESFKVLKDFNGKKCGKDDFDTEFLDFKIAFKVIDNLDEAINHINKHSLHHTDIIVSQNKESQNKFFQMIDSACVFANISSQFADGEEFGLGAEIGISTQKLHARGPFATKAMTTEKWILSGDGQIRDL